MVIMKTTTNQRKFHNIFLILILSGAVLFVVDLVLDFDKDVWSILYNRSKDIQMFGAVALALYFCPYKHLNTKIILSLLTLWRLIVFIVNIKSCDSQIPAMLFLLLNAFYVLWLLRLLSSRRKTDYIPIGKEGYHIFVSVSTPWGLLQALFLPWHNPIYESRMISDGTHIWSVYHGKFAKIKNEDTDINKIDMVRVPLGRRLNTKEYKYLNSLVGQKAIRGIRDCRKFLKIRR